MHKNFLNLFPFDSLPLKHVYIIYFHFRWFCHFDDDNYVNVPALVRKLKQYDHNKDWYLGKPSIPEPLEIMDREHNNVSISFT